MIATYSKAIVFLVGILISIFYWNCSEDTPIQVPKNSEPVLSNLLAPSVVYSNSSSKHTISVKVVDAQGIEDIQRVWYEISKAGSNVPLQIGPLVDDGTSGDIIPKDGVYSNQIVGSFAQNDTGDFNLEVKAEDAGGNISNSLMASIRVLSGTENLPPKIINAVAPKTVPIDSSFDFIVAAEVADPEGLSDIKRVMLQFFPPAHPIPTLERELRDDGTLGDETAGDALFSTQLSSSLIQEASDYFLRFQAFDKAGNKSEAEVVTIQGRFGMNDPPVISNLVAPDTVKINPAQDTKILITVEVTDPQGLSDIDYVQFRSFLPNGQEASNSPIQMADDGNQSVTGDQVAGDGTYSRIIVLPSSGVTPGDFKFVFQAKDKSNAFSNTIEHILTVID